MLRLHCLPQRRRQKKKGSTDKKDIISVLQRLVGELAELQGKDSEARKRLVAETREQCHARVLVAIASARRDAEPLLSSSDAFAEGDVEPFTSLAHASIEAALARLDRVIRRGALAFKSCAGMEKLQVRG